MTKQEFFNFYYNQLEDAVYLTESVDELKEEGWEEPK